MKANISDIIKLLEEIAPSNLAEDWDNVGLQVGKRDWPVETIWVALDPLPEVVTAAYRDKVNLLITHHPLIFSPINNLDFDTPLGTILKGATENRLGILSIHTNLDAATDGINDVLASKIGLKNVRVLGDEILPELCSFTLYVSPDQEQSVMDVLFQAMSGGSHIHPAGETFGSIRKTAESVTLFASGGEEKKILIEAAIRKNEIGSLLSTVKKVLPSGALDYQINPLLPIHSGLGLGRVGELEGPLDLNAFAISIKEKLELTHAKVAGPPDLIVTKAAVCSGSGSGLLGHFYSSDAQVYISGDLRYHDARDAEAQNRGLIDIGHFASEHIILEALTEQLQMRSNQADLDVDVKACGLEKDPFMII